MEGPDDWLANTQGHLRTLSSLRQEVKKQFRRADFASAPGDQDVSFGGSAVEDKLKKRYRTTQCLVTAIASKIETAQQAIFQVRQCVSDLSRTATSTRAALSVVELRLEMRLQRPRSELIEDSFNEALQQEQVVLNDGLGQLTAKLEAGVQHITPLEESKSDLNACRLTVHLDRTGYTQEVLDKIEALEKEASSFCREGAAMMDDIGRQSKKALAKTNSAMKQRIAATVELKEKLEKDVKETRRTINEANLHLERLQKQLHAQLAMPERQLANVTNKKLLANTGAVAELRAKLKAAAYTGTQGRQLNVLFGRFDRDNSGFLDEDEVRRAFRRACRVPPSAVTDAEIASLCTFLDEDKSGTISISEIVEFLCADCDVECLQLQNEAAKDALEKLKAAQSQAQIDLRNKVAAWKIDAACARVNPIKGLKLDSLPSARRPETASMAALTQTGPPALLGRPVTSAYSPSASPSATPRIGSNRKFNFKAKGQSETLPALPTSAREASANSHASPMDSKVLENVRSRIKAAAYTGTSGRQLDVVFSRFDKDGSGKLGHEEIRQALRRTLKIPPSLISDTDISALCAVLDTDKSGNISVGELVEFVGTGAETSKRTDRQSLAKAPLLANAKQGAPPDESAGL